MALGSLVEEKLTHYFHMNGDISKGSNLYQYVMKEVEKSLLKLVLRETQGNQVKASEVLGINRNTLRKKMQLYKISVK